MKTLSANAGQVHLSLFCEIASGPLRSSFCSHALLAVFLRFAGLTRLRFRRLNNSGNRRPRSRRRPLGTRRIAAVRNAILSNADRLHLIARGECGQCASASLRPYRLELICGITAPRTQWHMPLYLNDLKSFFGATRSRAPGCHDGGCDAAGRRPHRRELRVVQREFRIAAAGAFRRGVYWGRTTSRHFGTRLPS